MDTGGTKDRIGLCEFCGKKYFKRYNAQKYCCKSCATSAQSKRKKQFGYLAAPKPGMRKKCRLCGEFFHPADPRQLYCSDGCRTAMQKVYKLNNKPAAPKTVSRKKKAVIRTGNGYSMRDILKYMKENDCQYAEAVRKLEGGGRIRNE